MKPQNQDMSERFRHGTRPGEDPIDYPEMKAAIQEKIKEVKEQKPNNRSFVVCIGNKAFFNLK